MNSRVVLASLVLGLVLTLGSAGISLAAPPMDYDVPNGHFFQQANGQGGAGNTGFAVLNDGGINFWTWFNRFGGVDVVGYPVSNRFQWNGFTVQAFQKVVFQWRPESQTVMFVNVFDELTAAGKDDWLLVTQSVPKPFDWSSDTGKTWNQVVASHLAIMAPYPSIQAVYNSAPDPVMDNGLPMSVQDFGNVVVLRAQRKAFQLWRVAVPWAAAGQVVVANGGDTGKAAGLYPQDAITPRPWGVVPTPTGCPAPAFSSFTATPNTISPGQSVVLSWGAVSNATAVTIDNGIGGVPTPGSIVVTPSSTTVYVMTAFGPCGQAQTQVIVYVNAPPGPTATATTQPTPSPTVQPTATATSIPQPIPQVTQVSPANGAAVPSTTIMLTWLSADMPGSPHYVYNVEVEEAEGQFWIPYASPTNISGTSFTFTVDITYFTGRWRVWAVNPGTGGQGPMSPWWEFHVQIP